MKTYFKKNNLGAYLATLLCIGFTTVSCNSVNSGFYDTDGIYNTGKIKAPVTHNETEYFEEYFKEKQNETFETFTDVDSYTSYENGAYPGWGENNSNTNIFINTGFNSPYWGWNNFYPGYGWNWGFGYNNYFGWNYGFGFGGGFGWGYPYYGNGWGYPYYGYNTRNVSRTSNTRTISNGYRDNSTRSTRNSNLTRNGRVSIENSRENATRLNNISNTRRESSNTRISEIRNNSTRTNTTRQNTRETNYNTPSRNTTINSSPTRTSSPATRSGGSMGGGRSSSGGRR